jgi:hypothetical protein
MEMDTRKLRSETRSANAERKHVSDESEKIVSQTQKVETAVESRGSLPLKAYVSDSKRPIRIGAEMGANSRVLRLSSIAQYRTKRRRTTAERASRSEQ